MGKKHKHQRQSREPSNQKEPLEQMALKFQIAESLASILLAIATLIIAIVTAICD